MAKKVAKVKNISTSNFMVTFDEIEKGKRFNLRPDASVAITEDELIYLTNECPNAFKKGYLEIIEVDSDVTTDIPVTENKMTMTDIEELLNSNFNKMKASINKINESHVLKDIRIKAEEMNKSSKVIDIIDSRIKEVADSLVL